MTTAEKEMEPSVPVLEFVTTGEEIEPPAPVSEVVFLEADISGQEDIGLHTVKPTILVSEEAVDPIVEESLPRDCICPETEADVPTVRS